MSNLERAAAIAEPALLRVMEHQRGRPAVKVEVSSNGTTITFSDNSTLTFPQLSCGSQSRASDVEYATVVVIAAVRMLVVRSTLDYDRLEDRLQFCTSLSITRNPVNGTLSTTVNE